MKVLRIVLIFALFFIIVEIACRIIMPSEVKIIDNKTGKRIWLSGVIESSRKGKRFKPNLDLTVYNAWISHWPKLIFRTNSLGLRGDEITIKEPDNDYRILVLGDSITWSGYLPEEKTYVYQMGSLLSRKLNRDIPAINGGIGDVGIAEEADFVKEVYCKIKPKILILSFYLNDSRPSVGFESEKSLSWARFLQKSRFIDFLYNNGRLQIFLMRSGILGKGYRYRWFYLSKDARWKTDKSYFKRMISDADLDWGAAWNENSWPIVERNIDDLKMFCDKKGLKFMITCFPVSFQVYSDFTDDLPQQRLGAIAKKYNILFLDLLPKFRENKRTDLFYDHCHLNPDGQALAAKAIAEFIVDKKLIQK